MLHQAADVPPAAVQHQLELVQAPQLQAAQRWVEAVLHCRAAAAAEAPHGAAHTADPFAGLQPAPAAAGLHALA